MTNSTHFTFLCLVIIVACMHEHAQQKSEREFMKTRLIPDSPVRTSIFQNTNSRIVSAKKESAKSNVGTAIKRDSENDTVHCQFSTSDENKCEPKDEYHDKYECTKDGEFCKGEPIDSPQCDRTDDKCITKSGSPNFFCTLNKFQKCWSIEYSVDTGCEFDNTKESPECSSENPDSVCKIEGTTCKIYPVSVFKGCKFDSQKEDPCTVMPEYSDRFTCEMEQQAFTCALSLRNMKIKSSNKFSGGAVVGIILLVVFIVLFVVVLVSTVVTWCEKPPETLSASSAAAQEMEPQTPQGKEQSQQANETDSTTTSASASD